MKLFISYAHVDRYRVEELVEILQNAGHEAWFDHKLLPGQDWQQELLDAVLTCDVFVYAMTQNSIDSEWCQWEFQQSVKHGKSVVPVLIHKSTIIPDALSKYQYADFSSGPTPIAVAQLVGGIHNLSVQVPVAELDDTIVRPSGFPAQAILIDDQSSHLPWRWLVMLALVLLVGGGGLFAIQSLTGGDEQPTDVASITEETDEPQIPTEIPTNTDEPTEIPTGTLVPSDTPTDSPPTPTPSHTPTDTPTLTPSDTPTDIPTRTYTPTPSVTPYENLELTASELVDQAIELYNSGDYIGAIGLYTQALRIDPGNTHAYYGRGIAYDDLDKYELAIADYTEVIRLDPNYAFAFNNRGIVYKSLEEYELAIADYTEAIRLDPDYAFAFNNRGTVYKSLEEYELAIADYDDAIRLDPEYALAFNNRGDVYYAQEQYQLAINDYTEAIELDPTASRYVDRGLAYYYSGEYELAIADYDDAIRLDPDYPISHLVVGYVYDEQEQFDLALQNYETYLELAGDSAEQFIIDRVAELRAN